MGLKFIRRDSVRFSKLGKGRRKLQKWRKPKGRDNKMRLQMKGYPDSPSIGWRKSGSISGKIDGLTPKVVNNLKELQSINNKTYSVILSSKVGAKKKIDLIKKAEEMKIKIINLGGRK